MSHEALHPAPLTIALNPLIPYQDRFSESPLHRRYLDISVSRPTVWNLTNPPIVEEAQANKTQLMKPGERTCLPDPCITHSTPFNLYPSVGLRTT